MFTKTQLLTIAILFSLLSCKKEISPSITSSSTPPAVATLKVTVLKFYLNKGNQQIDSALKNTVVYVYDSEYDLTNNNAYAYSGKTDSAGVVVFTGLTQTQYYIQTNNAQFGIKSETVNTPLNDVALAEVDY